MLGGEKELFKNNECYMSNTQRYLFHYNGKQLGITESFLKRHPDVCFIFSDNEKRVGKMGSAMFRDLPNTYGFVTKKLPGTTDNCCFTVQEYIPVYKNEIKRLIRFISDSTFDYFIISRLGEGSSNKFDIRKQVILPNIQNDLDGQSYYIRFLN